MAFWAMAPLAAVVVAGGRGADPAGREGDGRQQRTDGDGQRPTAASLTTHAGSSDWHARICSSFLASADDGPHRSSCGPPRSLPLLGRGAG
ncbi:hypothetical protein [Modestobacter sp. VKM Ac-2981]|uniref:hypothetical protein n=1 Tax=Modestobacter sp. VKM Ac-2981 TaxID=3004135 RepID=UPI0022AAC927|nr:hypothetical protein [Modestobacter sp. VKM Ac-2981]